MDEPSGGAGEPIDVAVVGAGPAGLFAAECLAQAGFRVCVFERMPSPARKLLMAGRGGLNLTHSEPLGRLLTRYRPPDPRLLDALSAFPPGALTDWADELGAATFTGTSGRIFPKAMKASPLVRAWLARLDRMGVRLRTGHTLTAIATRARPGFATPEISLTFARKAKFDATVEARAVLLAVGGASWPRLGTDGSWVSLLQSHGVAVTPLAPANAGLIVPWSAYVRDRFAGTPLKRIVLSVADASFSGDLMITRAGLEGTPAYSAGPTLRAAIAAGTRPVPIMLDLRPDLDHAALVDRLSRPHGRQSLASILRKSASLAPPAITLLHEPTGLPKLTATSPADEIAARIKALPLAVTGVAGLERAISTAGGVAWSALDGYMLRQIPGVFVAGEMVDWEAPTGGYLLQGCFATAAAASLQITEMLESERRAPAAFVVPNQ